MLLSVYLFKFTIAWYPEYLYLFFMPLLWMYCASPLVKSHQCWVPQFEMKATSHCARANKPRPQELNIIQRAHKQYKLLHLPPAFLFPNFGKMSFTVRFRSYSVGTHSGTPLHRIIDPDHGILKRGPSPERRDVHRHRRRSSHASHDADYAYGEAFSCDNVTIMFWWVALSRLD